MSRQFPRRPGRLARRSLTALLLVLAYASAAPAASADAQGASREAARERGEEEENPTAARLSDAFLRLVEASATRSTQWHHRQGGWVDGGASDGSSNIGSSTLAALLAPPSAAAPAPFPVVVSGAHEQQPQQKPLPPSMPTTAATATAAAAAAAPGPPSPHPPLLPPSASDFVVLLLAALTLFTAAGGGVGGGTLFVPLFSVIGGFAPTNAVALSNVTVFGGALANFLLNVRRPYARALKALPRNALAAIERPPPLIDWTLILIMEPATLVGALAGGYAHRLLPTWMLLTLLSALLIFLTRQLALKAAATWAAETREQQRERAAEWANRAAGEGLGGGGGGVTAPLLGVEGDEDEADSDEEAARGGNNETNDEKQQRSRPRPPPLIVVAAGLDSSTLALSDDVGGGDQDPSAAGSSSSAVAAGGAARATPRPRRAEGDNRDGDGDNKDDDDPLERLLKVPARVPVGKVLAITALTAWMLCSDVVKTRLPCGSALYTLASLSIVPLAVAVSLAQRARVLQRAAAAAEAHDAFDAARRQASLSSRPPRSASGARPTSASAVDVDLAAPAAGGGQWSPEAVSAALASHVRWNRRNSVLYPLLATLAGVAASMFGIGGGVVKGPLMLSLGVCPEVAAATSSTMILFTSAGASLFYSNAGFLQRDYAAALLLVGFAFTGLGQLASQRLVRALGRRSVIVMVMAAMMLAAAVVAVLQSAFATRAAVRARGLWHWGSICSRGDD